MELHSTPVNTVTNILGTVTANVMNYFDIMFPKGFFNHKYVDTKLTSVERYQSKKQLIGNRTPAISFQPNLNIEDVEFKGHEFIKPEVRIFHCDEDKIHINTYFERIKVDFDIKIKLETRSKVYDTVVYMKNQMHFNAPFFLDMSGAGTAVSIPVPNEILKQIMILKDWYGDDDVNDIENLTTYLDTFKQGVNMSFKKSLNLALGRNSIFLNYPANILTTFSGLPSFEFGKQGRARGDNYITTSLTTEFWIPTGFSLIVDNKSPVLDSFKQISIFIKLMTNADMTKIKTLEFRNLISEIFYGDRSDREDIKYDVNKLLDKPEFYSLKSYFNTFVDSDNYQDMVYSLKDSLDNSTLNSFMSGTREILSSYLESFGMTDVNAKEGSLVSLSLTDDWNKYTDSEKSFIEYCESNFKINKTEPNHLDVIKEFNSSYELNYERKLVMNDNSPNRLHKGAPMFVTDTSDMMTHSLDVSIIRNDKFVFKDIVSEKKNQVDDVYDKIMMQIENGEDVRVDDLRSLHSDISNISQFDDMMVLNFNLLSHPEYDKLGKKLFYYNGFTTEVNSRIDTLGLASEFDEEFKNVLDYYISSGEDVIDLVDVVVYSRDIFVRPSDYNMNWGNFILTINNPKYNMNYYIVMYKDMPLYENYKKRWFESNII